VFEYRNTLSKPAEPQRDGVSIEQRIRELKARGHTRFAIQVALKVSLKQIEAALEGRS